MWKPNGLTFVFHTPSLILRCRGKILGKEMCGTSDSIVVHKVACYDYGQLPGYMEVVRGVWSQLSSSKRTKPLSGIKPRFEPQTR